MDLSVTSVNFSNTSTPGPAPPALWGVTTLAPVLLLSLCFLVGFPGNLTVLILKPNFSRLSKVTQCLMVNLAMSDLLCLATLPVWVYTMLYDWTLGLVTCKILAFVVHCCLHSSLLTLTALSIQRYIQVVHPQMCLQLKKKLLIVLWIISMTLSIPPLVVRQTIRNQQQTTTCLPKYSCPAQQVAVLLTECIVGLSSFAVTSCAYFFLKRKLDQAAFFSSSWTSRLVTSIIVTFFTMWMPYLIFNLVVVGGVLNNNQIIVEFYDLGYRLFASVIFVNSCLNPLLYAFALRICNRTGTSSGNSEEPPGALSTSVTEPSHASHGH